MIITITVSKKKKKIDISEVPCRYETTQTGLSVIPKFKQKCQTIEHRREIQVCITVYTVFNKRMMHKGEWKSLAAIDIKFITMGLVCPIGRKTPLYFHPNRKLFST